LSKNQNGRGGARRKGKGAGVRKYGGKLFPKWRIGSESSDWRVRKRMGGVGGGGRLGRV